ncbi:MAG: methyltransferase [Candidatus Bathyarchaeota archaeon]|nr:methyltransferase [Candidatus Bathyarchaeota archaeon]
MRTPVVLIFMEPVYQPAEDSYLLTKHVERLVFGQVLDMGTGSGIQAVTAATKPQVEHVVAVDINPAALIVAEKRAVSAGVLGKIEFVLSDLFSNLSGVYDWILFNTPYLPSEGDADEASWAGGETGSEMIRRFLGDAPKFLRPDGSVLMIYSSHSGLDEDAFEGYLVEMIEEVGLFFEKICCVRLSPS